MRKDIIARAEDFASELHLGQFRKAGDNVPYITHPFAVRDILVSFGYDDVRTQVTAILHDTVEDTDVFGDKRNIEKNFGGEIYSAVYALSNNTIGKHSDEYQKMMQSLGVSYLGADGKLTEEAYKTRIIHVEDWVKRIKLADMIHNMMSLPDLSKGGIERKIRDAQDFYIPLGRCVEPLMAKRLEANISDYLMSEHYQKTFGS